MTVATSVNLAEKLAQFDEHWAPRTVAAFNGHDVMVVKVKGEFAGDAATAAARVEL